MNLETELEMAKVLLAMTVEISRMAQRVAAELLRDLEKLEPDLDVD